MKSLSLFWLLLLALAASGVAQETGDAKAISQEATHSAASSLLSAAEAQLELRGIMVTSEGAKFNLFDGVTGTTRWVRLGESQRGFRISEFRSAENVILLTTGTTQLALVLAGGRSNGGTSRLAVAAAGSALDFSSAGATAFVLPADQQERLNEIAMEVRRRQAARIASGNLTAP